MRTAAGQAGCYIRKARTQARDGVRRGARGRCPAKPRNATSRGVRPRRARVMTGLPGHAAALAGRRAWRRAWAGRPTAAEDDGGWRATLARAVPGRAVVHRLRALEAREVFGDSVRRGVAGRLHQSCTAPPRTLVSHRRLIHVPSISNSVAQPPPPSGTPAPPFATFSSVSTKTRRRSLALHLGTSCSKPS